MDIFDPASLVAAVAGGLAVIGALGGRRATKKIAHADCSAIGTSNDIGWYCEHGKHVHKRLSTGKCFCGKGM